MKKTLLFFLTLSFYVQAQNTGDLSGRIIDLKSQQPLEGATVLLEDTSLGVITDADGYFTFEAIPTQTYNVIVSYLGLKVYESCYEYVFTVRWLKVFTY